MLKSKYESTVTPIREIMAKSKDLFATTSNAEVYQDLVQYMFSTWCSISESELNGLGICLCNYNGDWVEIGVGFNLRASVGITIELTNYCTSAGPLQYSDHVELVIRTPSESEEKQIYSKSVVQQHCYANTIRNGKQFRSIIRKWLQWAQGQVTTRLESVHKEQLQLQDAGANIFEALKVLDNAQ